MILEELMSKGVFGEVNYAISDTTELTLGARWYDIAVDFEGSANSSFGNGFGNPDEQRYGSNLSVQYAPGNANGYPDKAESNGVIGKATLHGIQVMALCTMLPGQKDLDLAY
ncbi:MAG: hypothetical protein CM15mP126_5520 [Gammaproteobacteria bacterium]|nr:MAG: hypothetical protein CM15mP126_5520 [Gammaproteobacteria bacterium]